MLSYLHGSTRPYISMAVHQCVQFCNNPRPVHKLSVRLIAKYLASTSTYVDLPYGNRRLTTRGVVYNPNIEKGIDCYVDAEFSSGWAQVDSNHAENVMLRTVYAIKHAVCSVLWCSKLQTEITLFTTEAEYIALIQAMRGVITFMVFMKEVYSIFNIHIPKPGVCCKIFEYNKHFISVS